jgi:hypothetical protein
MQASISCFAQAIGVAIEPVELTESSRTALSPPSDLGEKRLDRLGDCAVGAALFDGGLAVLMCRIMTKSLRSRSLRAPR